MLIRPATPADASAACDTIRRSITELCTADHASDPTILQCWLANKTPDNLAAWITKPGNSVLVAAETNTILALGSVTDQGEITLRYVSPDARFRGISRAMLAALEARARERGNTTCTLTSTETARRFYETAGYIQTGPSTGKFGTGGSYPMTKQLAP